MLVGRKRYPTGIGGPGRRRVLSMDCYLQGLAAPQIQLTDGLAWGLGPGIQDSPQGAALWQWGQHLDFQSVMIIYPQHGFGVVVCTNNDLLNPDVAINIAHRAIGGRIDRIRGGAHLYYDYRLS